MAARLSAQEQSEIMVADAAAVLPHIRPAMWAPLGCGRKGGVGCETCRLPGGEAGSQKFQETSVFSSMAEVFVGRLASLISRQTSQNANRFFVYCVTTDVEM